ncbi:hypothetical protein JY446_08690 [Serratia marcescens]|nr:hypothetical protein BVG96_22710 [Serratia marcescens]EGS9994455.1 hypothetical protein [Serratia marcescens]ELJ5770884.1 hypothetical protein [Serratia marcescens]ELJ5814940.1 hypothetical protein [Serratia marcescens]ELN8907780.1 hypothetical protein [Serratia marcescens]
MPLEFDNSFFNKIDPFSLPLEIWEEREPTEVETDELLSRGEWRPCCQIKVKIDLILNSAHDAARLIAGNKDENRIDNHVISYLEKNMEYKKWRECMPHSTPKQLIDYQENYPPKDFEVINSLISKHGMLIPVGQALFHGGIWPLDKMGGQVKSFLTNRVLSTSFCPKVALNNGDWRGKAYDAGRIDLMVITIKSIDKKAFVFSLDEGSHSHEMEVLFERGVQLSLVRSSTVNLHFKTCKSTSASDIDCKFIAVNVLQIEMI